MSASAADAGVPNSPGVLDSTYIIWEKLIPKEWWRNTHERASNPLAFSNAAGRFSHPSLPFNTLYLGSDPITCFWESGLGRNLNRRFLTDRTIPENDLRERIEYTVSLDSTALRLFNANDSAMRRSIRAHSIACFQADHVVSRQWANTLFSAGANGILYSSARSNGTCLAVFESPATLGRLGLTNRVRSSYDNPALLASLILEGVRFL